MVVIVVLKKLSRACTVCHMRTQTPPEDYVSWEGEISKCFGVVDKNFAIHPVEKRHAQTLRRRLVAEGVSWAETRDAFRSWLDKTECDFDHFSAQMEKVQRYFAPYLKS